MSLLRIRVSLLLPPLRCEWALLSEEQESIFGEGLLAELPPHAVRIQLILPAPQMLITPARVPQAARRHTGSVLAYAIEDKTLPEPDANQVSWLGKMYGKENEITDDLLAVIDKAALQRWQHALEAAGIRDYEIHCETLMLPYQEGEWSMAWDGQEGYVRSGEFDGAASDCGDHEHAPLSLYLMLKEAKARDRLPAFIVIYTAPHTEKPDIKKWSHDLDIPVRYAGHWDWRNADMASGINLAQKPKNGRFFTGALRRLQAAAWILGAALVIHGSALVIEKISLVREQHRLQEKMELRFREVFPEAVSVSDPVLQMRRKLSEARNATGHSDSSDFIAMIEPLALAMKNLPAGAVQVVTYDTGRMTVELPTVDETQLNHIITTLKQSGMQVDIISPSTLGIRSS